MKSIIVYVDMDDVLCHYTESYNAALETNPKIQYPQSQFDFYRKLKPINGGIQAVNYLDSLEAFDVYFLTAPSVFNPLCYTEKRLWIEDHFGLEMTNRLIISPNKGLCKGDYLIDDHVEGRGQENFEGKLIAFGSSEFKNWDRVVHYFKIKYKL